MYKSRSPSGRTDATNRSLSIQPNVADGSMLRLWGPYRLSSPVSLSQIHNPMSPFSCVCTMERRAPSGDQIAFEYPLLSPAPPVILVGFPPAVATIQTSEREPMVVHFT